MDTNLIILELLSRIKVLEEKVNTLETGIFEALNNNSKKPEKPVFPIDNVSEKYRALAEYLYEKWEKKIVLTYTEIEEVLNFKLPTTAYNFPKAYWANTLTHSYATSWLSVGYKARVNSETMSVTFEKTIY